MSEGRIDVPEPCAAALRAIEADPMDLSAAVLDHLRACPACAETRVLWLAQEDAPPALAPAGYFERLPNRLLGKLPARTRSGSRRTGWLAAAAAALLVVTAGGGFWAGRANREPLVEASTPRTPADLKESQPQPPFHDTYEVIEQFQSLSPEEAQALLKQLEKTEPKSQP